MLIPDNVEPNMRQIYLICPHKIAHKFERNEGLPKNICSYHIHGVNEEADEFRQHFIAVKLESIPCLKYSKR